jgi:carbon-monoxide dehydrogenase small subunit
MMMTARWLLDHHPDPSPAEIREALSGQLCRCTGYENIVRSVQWASENGASENGASEDGASEPGPGQHGPGQHGEGR